MHVRQKVRGRMAHRMGGKPDQGFQPYGQGGPDAKQIREANDVADSVQHAPSTTPFGKACMQPSAITAAKSRVAGDRVRGGKARGAIQRRPGLVWQLRFSEQPDIDLRGEAPLPGTGAAAVGGLKPTGLEARMIDDMTPAEGLRA